MMTEVFKIGDAVIERSEDFTVTRYSDGLEVIGEHLVQPGQDDTAKNYGLTAEEMNYDHDLAHSLVSYFAGSSVSPTLRGVATNDIYQYWWREEMAVLSFQGYVKQLGGSITELARLETERK